MSIITFPLTKLFFYERIIMDADVTAILAAIDVVSKKVDSAKNELKEDI